MRSPDPPIQLCIQITVSAIILNRKKKGGGDFNSVTGTLGEHLFIGCFMFKENMVHEAAKTAGVGGALAPNPVSLSSLPRTYSRRTNS